MIAQTAIRREHYPDTIAKLNNSSKVKAFVNRYQTNKQQLTDILDSGIELACTQGYIKGRCGNSHTFLKAIFCGKEYCFSCGQNGSLVHQRRIARWLPKVNTYKALGYLVITIPKELRTVFMDQKECSSIRVAIKRKLQRMGFKNGLMRWHLFGSCPTCNEKGCLACYNTGGSEVFKPHLNIFIDSGWLSRNEFDKLTGELKNFLAKYWRKTYAMELTANVNYSYSTERPEILNKLKYVTRATFRRYSSKLSKIFKGFRMSQTWGEFDTNDYEEKSKLVLLEKNVCPCCKELGERQSIDWKAGRNNEIDINNLLKQTGVVQSKIFGEINLEKTEPKKRKLSLLTREEVGRDRCILKHIEGGYYLYEEPFEQTKSTFDRTKEMATEIPIKASELEEIANMMRVQKEYFRVRSPYLLTESKRLEARCKHILQKYISAGVIGGKDLVERNKSTDTNTNNSPGLFDEPKKGFFKDDVTEF